MKRIPDAATGGLLVLAASVQFGVVVVVGTVLLREGIAVQAMLAIRFAIAAVIVMAVAASLHRSAFPACGERLRLALLGLGGYGVEALLFFAAVKHGTATAVTLLFFTYPVAVAITSRLTGECSQGKVVGGALIAAVAGAVIVVASGGSVAIRPLGVVLALGSAAMFTIYLIGVNRVMKTTNSLTAAGWVSAWASVGLFASLLFIDGRITPASSGEWTRVTVMGAATAGAFVCLMGGLRLLGPVRTSIVAAAEPLSSGILAKRFLSASLRAPFTDVGGTTGDRREADRLNMHAGRNLERN